MADSSQPLRPPINPALGTFLLLLCLNLLNYIDRYILPGEVSLIQREFHSTDQQMGALTTALFLCYMFTAPLTGWLGDRFSRKPLIIAGAVLWSVATLGTAWVHDYWTLYIRHALVGVGEATFGIFAPTVLADFYPERDRNRILSIFYIAIPVGAALGYLAGGQMGPLWGWRAPFFICAIPGLAVALLYGFIGREPTRGASDHLKATPSRATFVGLFTNPAFLTATFGLAALTFAMGGISSWVPEFLRRSAGLSVGRASQLVGASTVLDGIAGTLIGGMIAQRWLRTNHRALYLLSFLERRAHAALRPASLLRTRKMGGTGALRRRVLSLPQYRPAQHSDREFGWGRSPRHRRGPEPLHHSLFWRYVFAPDHRSHQRPHQPVASVSARPSYSS